MGLCGSGKGGVGWGEGGILRGGGEWVGVGWGGVVKEEEEEGEGLCRMRGGGLRRRR